MPNRYCACDYIVDEHWGYVCYAVDIAHELKCTLAIVEQQEIDDYWQYKLALKAPSTTAFDEFQKRTQMRITFSKWNAITAKQFRQADIVFHSDSHQQHMAQFTSNTHRLAEKNLVHKAYQTLIEDLQLNSHLTQILLKGGIKTAGDFLVPISTSHHAVRASLDNVQASQVFHALRAKGLEEPLLLSLVPYNNDTDNYGMAGILERLAKKISENIPFGQYQPIAVVKHAISLLTDCEKTYFESKHRWDAQVVCDGQTVMIATANAMMNVDLHSQFWLEGNINIAVRIVQSIADVTNGSFFIGRTPNGDILITPTNAQQIEGQ